MNNNDNNNNALPALAEFGKAVRKEHYLLNQAENAHFANHGSYGGIPKEIFEKRAQLQRQMESHPDKWFRFDSYPMWQRSVNVLSQFLHLKSASNLVLCDNATDGINAVLKSIEFSPDSSSDCILASEYTYGAILNAIDYTSSYRRPSDRPIHVHKLPLTLPIVSKQQIVDEYERAINEIVNVKKLNLKLVVLDHISSATAILYPIKEIVQLIRKLSKHSLILVDGAHAIGQFKLSNKDDDEQLFGCDFYVSNLHKWFFAPRGCAFLYFKDFDYASKHLQPNFISWLYKGSVNENFFSRATSDKTSHLLVEECIRFHSLTCGGLDRISAYCTKLVSEASRMLVEAWQTSEFDIAEECRAPFMRMVRLPVMKKYSSLAPDVVAVQLIKDILVKYNLIVLFTCVNSTVYCRISAFIYNHMEDYEALRDAILDLNSNN